MSEEIKFDHFKDINDLLKNIDSWYREDDIEYTRWFGLEDLYNLKIYIKDLQQKVEQLENENFNIRENIHLERISLPPELTKDKDFMELYDIPSYEDLKNKVEQLENELKVTNNLLHKANDEVVSYCNRCIELENIRKEAIKWVNKHTTKFKDIYIPASESWYLLDMLNGSDENE